ncbi:MAG TPA: hypothetical protein VEZ11_09490 [Thermoanaerobaculia bacterium]|nr:hypothetical protein [Thermoanaerobaculia bacterium]
MSIKAAYGALTAEQKQIIAEKKAEVKKPIGEIIPMLVQLAAFEKEAARVRGRSGCGFFLAVVAVPVLAIITGNGVLPPFIGWPLVLIDLALTVFVATVYFRTRSVDLSANLGAVAVPVLVMFRDDIDAAAPVEIRLDLRKPMADAKKVRQSEPYKHGVYKKIVDVFYEDAWLAASAVLRDGNRLALSVTDTIRKRSKTKTMGGKTKTKLQTAKRTEIDVDLTVKSKRFTIEPPPGATVKEGDGKRTVSVRKRTRSKNLTPIPPNEIIDVVTGLYSAVRPAQ